MFSFSHKDMHALAAAYKGLEDVAHVLRALPFADCGHGIGHDQA